MNVDSFIKKFSFINNFNNYPDGVVVIDSLSNITFWNKKAGEIFGYSANQMIGRNIAILFDADVEKVKKALETGEICVISSKNSSDKDIFVEISCKYLSSKKKTLITVRDVTKTQKVIEKFLVEYDRSTKISKNKNKFITGLSNDLKNPIHSLIGFSQGLLDGICGELNEKQLKYVNIMNKNANSLLEFVDNFLELSRLEQEQISFEMKMFDLVATIRKERARFIAKAEEKGLSFETDLKEIEKRNIYTNEEVLVKVLSNIIENAIKFTDSGNVRLKVLHPELEFVKKCGIEVPEGFDKSSYLLFSVADTGKGISEDELRVIFDEYLQIERLTAKKYGGTGLRLAINKKMILHLGGVIWAESELCNGSTFNFILPVEKPVNKKAEDMQPEEALQEIAVE